MVVPTVPPPGEVVIRRQIENTRACLIASGDFSDLLAGWWSHASLWDGEPDGLSSILMRQGLAAAALHLANRPRNETVAWTLNLKQPPTNLFLTGSSADGTITGRVITEGVRTEESSRLFVQVVKPRGEPQTSRLDVDGFDVLEIFEQYFDRSEQNPARFFALEQERFAAVLGLPGVDPDWLHALEIDAARALLQTATTIEERSFRFECGCSPERILTVMRSMFGSDPNELFHEENRVEVFCPRCGRRWWVDREQFDAG
jgi:molecular chaperone Hsp33